jgi:hypothetical protein
MAAWRLLDGHGHGSASVPILHSAAQRSAEITRRESFQRTLASSVDQAVAKATEDGDASDAAPSCFGGLYRLASSCARRRRHRRLLDIDVPASAVRTARAASGALAAGGVGLSLFGQRRAAGGASTAATRLAEVGESLDARIAAVEAKAVASKAEAAKLFIGGGKAAALRALRRSKAHEKQAAALSGTAIAIERQSAMLEDAGLQQQVANAMQAGVKGMKKTAKALKDVESVVDEASEMRDMSEDINAALSELGTAYNDPGVDDDDLLGELEEMATLAATKQAPAPQPVAARKVRVVAPAVLPAAFPVAPNGAVKGAANAATVMSAGE